MLETLNNIDTECFRWINGHHNTAADWVLWTVGQHLCWLVVLLLFFGLVTLRYESRKWWLMLAAVGLCFLLADQTSVLIKDTVERLRPCYALDDVRMFRTRCGGQYGFVSSHAANAFAVATLLMLRYRNRSTLACILLAVWVVLICYSRVYLGKHYPGDLLGGALLGIAVGWVVWLLACLVEKKMHKCETK